MKRFVLAAALLLFTTTATVWAIPFAALQGKPSLEIGDDFGYFAWHDSDGIHLRWTTKSHGHKFSGSVDAGGEIKDLHRVQLEGADWVVRTNDHAFSFSTATDQGVDGVDFRCEADKLTLSLDIDGHPIDVKNIHLGEKKVNPRRNPFPVMRQGKGQGKGD